MDRSVRAPRGAPPDAPERRRARRPDFLAPDDEPDPFDSTARRPAAKRPRAGASAFSSSTPPRQRRASAQKPGEPQLTLPSMPRMPAQRRDDEAWNEREESQDWQDDDESSPGRLPAPYADEDSDPRMLAAHARARPRERTSARPLSPVRRRQVATALDTLAHPVAPRASASAIAPVPPVPRPSSSGPYLPVALARPAVVRRVRVETQRIARAARNPWTGVRFVFALAAITLAILTATARMGEPAQPLMTHARWSAGGGSLAAAPIASLVRPETQIVQWQLYDSYQQFLDWRGAACSAATTSEVLTAWGVKNAPIGQVIDRMGSDISLDGGLINEHGFQRSAATYGYRADVSHNLTYAQMLYITNQLGLPIIVNVRISYGYYHYFDTGHFLVVTGGDGQGVSIVDSSTYYIHYLPLGVFFSMFTGRTYVIVPKDYQYSVPAI